MKKMIALTLVIVLFAFVFAPLPAFAWGGGNYGYYGHGGGYYGGHRGGHGGGISSGAAAAIGIGAFALGAILGRETAPVYYGSQPVAVAPYGVYPTVVVQQPMVMSPQAVWPAGCAPQVGYVYDDPYQPLVPRSVATGLIECRWPNGQTALYDQAGRLVQ